MIPHKLQSSLTAKTVGITFLIAAIVIGATALTSRGFGRLHQLIDNLANTQMESLMTSVRLVQQTESLISLGLMLSSAENHNDRRAAWIELTDRTAWIDQLTAELAQSGADIQLINAISHAERKLTQNIAQLNTLIRKRIDGEANDTERHQIRVLSSENRDLSGRLTVLLGYISAQMRSKMVAESEALSAQVEERQRNLIILSVVMLIAALLSGVYFERRVVRRILRVQRAVSQPNTLPADLEVGGGDEISRLAKTVGSYIERIQAQESRMQTINDELAFLAEHDPLTELANRRHFYAAAKHLMQSSRQPVCVALGDIDLFKAINDKYGHSVGDQALVHIAGIMRNGLRENDILSRFGGEEFAAILPVHSIDDAQVIFDLIRQGVASNPLQLENGKSIEVTMSFGLALIEDLPLVQDGGVDQVREILDTALRAADLALYEAKQAGRNRVFQAATPPALNVM